MPLSVTASSIMPTRLPPIAPAGAPASSGAASKTTGASSSATSQQTAALNQLLGKYKAGLQQGMAASSLSSLARQIASDAKTLGQTVVLPKGSAPAAETAPETPAGSGLLNKLT